MSIEQFDGWSCHVWQDIKGKQVYTQEEIIKLFADIYGFEPDHVTHDRFGYWRAYFDDDK